MNILFITATRLGDAVLTTGILNNIIKKYPQACLTIACGRTAAGIFKHVPGLEEILIIDKLSYNRHWLKLWQQCFKKHWDYVIDLRSSLISYLLNKNHLLRYHRINKNIHVIDEYQKLFHLQSPPVPHIWISQDERHYARHKLPFGEHYIALAPTAGSDKKIWPVSRYLTLWKKLTPFLPNYRPVLLYAPTARERTIVRTLLQELPHIIDLGRGYELTQIAAFLERCCLFIGSDSGLMHLCAACGTTTLGLFGPSRRVRYHPWGDNAYSLCAPGPEGEAPIRGLSVEKVADKALELCHHGKR